MMIGLLPSWNGYLRLKLAAPHRKRKTLRTGMQIEQLAGRLSLPHMESRLTQRVLPAAASIVPLWRLRPSHLKGRGFRWPFFFGDR